MLNREDELSLVICLEIGLLFDVRIICHAIVLKFVHCIYFCHLVLPRIRCVV
jgi:hypothetical protein